MTGWRWWLPTPFPSTEWGPNGDRPLVIDPADSLFALVEAITCDVVDWEIAYPTAASLQRVDARRMGSRVGSPVMVLELVGVGRKGRPRYHATELHRPGVVRYGMVRLVD